MTKAASVDLRRAVPFGIRDLLCSLTILTPISALGQSLPTGGSFVAGRGTISSVGNSATIVQSTTRGIINWNSFSIGSAGKVTVQNGAGATLNRVTGGAASTILGHLNATGSVYLINPNGVVIGSSGKVVTGGSFVASTRDTSNSQFMAGGAVIVEGSSSAGVSNAGQIIAEDGNVVLVGSSVANTGSISAPNGTAALAAARRVVLSEQDGPAGIYVAPDATSTGDVTNTGRIKAAAVALAAAGGNVYALAGNRSGLIEATGTKRIGGQVWLTAPNGSVSVDGTSIAASNADGSGGSVVANGRTVSLGTTAKISARATASGAAGGTILVGTSARGGRDLAQQTAIADGAALSAGGKGNGRGGSIETSGHVLTLGAAHVDAGTGGNWLLDPTDLTIGASSASAIDNALNAGTNVTEMTTATTASDGSGAATATSGGPGDITVASPLAWSSSATLTLSAFHSLYVDAKISISGNGTLVLTTDNNSGGTSSGGSLAFNGGEIQYTTTGEGALTINGQPYSLLWTVGGLEGMGSSGYFAVANNIDASSTASSTFTPIGTGAAFAGTLNGLGNTISHLSINNTASDVNLGLFAQIGSSGVVENIGLTGASITAGSSGNVGILAGINSGTIVNAYSSGVVTADQASADGGLVGLNYGTITQAYATGSASGTEASQIGGLVGVDYGTLTNVYSTSTIVGTDDGEVGGLVGTEEGTITNAYATGSITGGPDTLAGGLVGYNTASITSSYATGAVSGGDGAYVGGLVGYNDVSPSIITDAYATGAVSGGANSFVGGVAGYNDGAIVDVYSTGRLTGGTGAVIGGLVADFDAGTLTDGYFDTTTSGTTASSGTGASTGTGLTTTQFVSEGPLVSGSPFTFVNPSVWLSSAPCPILSGDAYIVLSATSAQVYGGPVGNVTITSILTENGNNASSLVNTSGLTWVSGAGSTGSVGTYRLGGEGATASGYQLLYQGTDTVTPRALTVTAGNASKTYGTTVSLGNTNFTTSGLINSDTVGSVTLASAGNAANTATVNVGSYAISASGATGTGLSNYTITYAMGVFTINPAALTITAGNESKTYGTTVNLGSTRFTAAGLLNSDTVSNVTLASTGSAATTGAGQYAINASSAIGSGLSNYTITYAPGMFTINPAALTVSATNQSKTYGASGSLGSTGFTTAGLLNNDTVTGVALSSPGTAASVGVGNYPITASGAAGSGLSNYTIAYVQGALTIDPAALTVAAGSQAKSYGSTASLGTTDFTTSGLLNSDTVTGLTLASSGSVAGSNVGGYAIVPSGASGAGLSNYTIAYADGTLTVDPAALTITADNQTKTYGQAANLSTSGFTTSGLVNSDTVTGVTLTSSGSSSAANTGAYAIAPSAATGTGLSNYAIAYASGTLSVDPAALTITAGDQAKTYGQADNLGTSGFTTSGLLNSDSVTGVTLASSGSTATSGTGAYAIVPSAAAGTGLGNYTIAYANGRLTVDPAALTITADDQTKTYGQAANLGTSGFTTAGLTNSDSVTGVTLTSAGGGVTASTGAYAIAPSAAAGTGLGNYEIAYVNGLLTVDPAALTITADSQTKTYGQAAHLGTSGFTTSGLLNSDSVTGVSLASGGGIANASTGAYAIVPSAAAGTGLGNYTIAYANGTLTVDPAALTITADDQSKAYGQASSLGSSAFSTAGLVNSDTVTGITLASSGSAAASGTGAYAIIPSAATGTGLANYTVSYADGTLTVDPAALTITANDQSKTYGQAAVLGTSGFTTSGLVNGDAVTAVMLTSTGTGATANAGAYAITPSAATGTSLSDYAISYVNGTLAVDPAALSVTADNQTKTYGQAANLGTSGFTTAGLLNSDSVTGVTLNSAGGTAAASTGAYAIVPSAAAGTGLGNYTIAYANGTLTIDPAALTITADGQSKTYGQSATLGTSGFTASGLVNSDVVTGVTLTSNGSASSTAVGTYLIDASSATGTGLGNYNIAYVRGLFIVNPAALTVTADDQSKTYGAVTNLGTTAFTTSGLTNGDTVTGVTLASGGTGAPSSAGAYAIIPSAAAGSGLSNYTVAYINGTLAVDPAALTVSAENESKSYGQTAGLGTTNFTTSGLLNGDMVSNVTLTSSGSGPTAGVGSYAIDASAANGPGVSNYAITYVPATLSVDPAALTVTARDQNKAYGSANDLGSTDFTTSGLLNKDTVTGVTLTSSGSVAGSNVGSYAIVPSRASGAGLTNYTVAYVNGLLTVDPAALTITADNQTKTYGQAANLGTSRYTTSGLLNSDSVTGVTLASGGSLPSSRTGAYAIVASAAAGTGLGNYTIGYANGTLTVDPAALTIAADDQTKNYGQTDGLGTTGFTTSGLLNGDAVTGVTLTSSGSTTVTSPGTYVINISNAVGEGLANYAIAYQAGTLTVNPGVATMTSATTPRPVFLPTFVVNADGIAPIPVIYPPDDDVTEVSQTVVSSSTGLQISPTGDQGHLYAWRGHRYQIVLPPVSTQHLTRSAF